MVKTTMRLATLLAMGLLAGCGSGGPNPFADFFGGGTTPGSAFAVGEGAAIQGVILERTSDHRILILGSASETTDATTPVQGALVSLLELQLSGQTGATGTYRFGDLQAGTYTLRITLPAALGGTTSDFRITVVAGQTVSGLPAAR
ncbi:MAG: carboxypeptidase regulatory-like domain-containing protein [Armatimonadetes bacterium]|nr:carboxypeptidase regulatory-like domain-containing protein [Armatimonadota bacterium]